MDADTTRNLITAGVGLTGALVGGAATLGATIVGQRRSHQAELGREARAEERRRAQDTEARERQAAETCDALVGQLVSVVEHTEDGPDLASRLHSTTMPLLQQLSTQSMSVPEDLRQRMDEGVLIFTRLDDLTREHYFAPTDWAARTVHLEIHRAVVAWLRGDELPERSDAMCDFILAAEKADEYYAEMYQMTLGREMDVEQEAWRRQHADALAEIRSRRQGR